MRHDLFELKGAVLTSLAVQHNGTALVKAISETSVNPFSQELLLTCSLEVPDQQRRSLLHALLAHFARSCCKWQRTSAQVTAQAVMPIAYSAERSVLLKILLHSAGHPSQSVNGVLLGKLKPKAASEAPQDGQGTPRAAQQQVAIEVVDALPFLHTFLTLAPMTEVALVQVRLAVQQTTELLLQFAFQSAADAVLPCSLQAEAYAHSKGLQLVGYYHANERLSDLDLGPAGRKIADRIQVHTPQACALLVGLEHPH